MNSSKILTDLLNEYEQQRLNNQAEEARRRQEAVLRCPEIGQLLEARENLIYGAMRGILNNTAQPQDIPARMEVLNRRLASLLKQNGFPEDWLDPVYRCKICRDTGYVGDTIRDKCSCLRSAYYRRLYREVGLTDPEHQSFESYNEAILPDTPLPGRSYSQRRLNAAIRTGCEKFASSWPDTVQLDVLLMGASGLGKTFIMHAMAKRMLDRNVNVLMMSAYRYFDIARKAYFSGDTTELDAILDTDVLMIDDLGTEPFMDNITVPQWLTLINERRGQGKSTVWSTNLSQKNLTERYTERISSRLLDKHQCAIFTFEGEDLRRR